MTYALCSDVTCSRATVMMVDDDIGMLELSTEDLKELGLDDTCRIIEVSDDVLVGQRIWI
jgi:hypothetical protein